MKYQTYMKWGGAVVAGVTLLGATSAAWADIKVVSEVTTKGRPESVKTKLPEKAIMTSYFKGEKQRVENEGDKSIVITDLASGKTYTLDPAKKTFTVFSLADVEKMMADNPIAQMLKVETQTTVEAGTATKTIAGKDAHQFTYNSNFKISIEGGADQLPPGLADMMPTIVIKGEQWTTEDIKYPTNYQKFAQNTMARTVPPMMAKGMKEMLDKMATIKGFPLSSVVTVSFILPKNAPPQVTASMPKEPIVTTTEVKTISDENLDDALFTVPTDYKEVKAASPVPGGLQ